LTLSWGSISQLASLTYTQGATILGTLTYAYDDAGNRTTVGGTWARTGLPQPQSTFVYNAANQLTKLNGARIASDGNGNLLDSRKQGQTLFDYTWNARNQLVGLSESGVSASFAYDGLGRRMSKTVNGTMTEFLYDGLNPVQELAGGSPVANLLTGLGIDEFVSRTEGGSPSTLLTDALGSTVALSNGTGTIQTEYTYEPFGAVTTSGTSSPNTYQFTGRESDGTGLMYYRARYYSPSLQRFISEDPVGFLGGDDNLYAYVFNSPLKGGDPLGLWTPDFHENTSKSAAQTCGMSDADATVLGASTRAPDFSIEPFPSLSTLDPQSDQHAMPGTNWLVYQGAQFNIAVETGSLDALGNSLHALQDSFSHDLANVGMWEHKGRIHSQLGVDPDDPSHPANRSRAESAGRATTNAIKDFMKSRGNKPKC